MREMTSLILLVGLLVQGACAPAKVPEEQIECDEQPPIEAAWEGLKRTHGSFRTDGQGRPELQAVLHEDAGLRFLLSPSESRDCDAVFGIVQTLCWSDDGSVASVDLVKTQTLCDEERRSRLRGEANRHVLRLAASGRLRQRPLDEDAERPDWDEEALREMAELVLNGFPESRGKSALRPLSWFQGMTALVAAVSDVKRLHYGDLVAAGGHVYLVLSPGFALRMAGPERLELVRTGPFLSAGSRAIRPQPAFARLSVRPAAGTLDRLLSRFVDQEDEP